MPTPNEAALIRQLARELAKRTAEVGIRSATVGARAIQAAIAAEAAAQARLAAEAARLGVPLAEATAEYGLSSGAAAGAGAGSGGVVIRTLIAIGRAIGLKGAGTAVLGGTAVVVVVGGVLVYGGAVLIGGLASDKPVEPGPAMTRPRPSVPPSEQTTGSGTTTTLAPPTGGAHWILDSVEVNPPTPWAGWTFDANSTSASYVILDGAYQVNGQWTRPPQQVDTNGFTVNLSLQAKAPPNQLAAGVIWVSGSGLDTDTPEEKRSLQATGQNGGTATAQSSVTFKPQPSASEIKVVIGFNWSIQFTYHYRRSQ